MPVLSQRGWFRVWAATLLLTLVAPLGCGGGPPVKLHQVKGTVKYSDGTVPTGTLAIVRFVPVNPAAGGFVKTAYGEIAPEDGSFTLMTVDPDDGAIAGTYKVVFTIFKDSATKASLVAEKFMLPEQTPFEFTVPDQTGEPLTLTIERAAE